MGGAVMTIDTLHLMAGQTRDRLSGRAIRQEGADFARIPVTVLDPGNGLTLLIGRCVVDFNSGAEMFPMNAAQISSSREHHQNGLRLGIRPRRP